ncbi:MAG: lipopolysaccharide biosynthesis protein [Pirellulaceae bacterium]
MINGTGRDEFRGGAPWDVEETRLSPGAPAVAIDASGWQSDGMLSLLLSGMALANYGVFYAVGIMLAHWLGASAYGDYCVAVASVTLAAGVSTLGLEKYALNILPAMLARESWPAIRGFWKVSQAVVLLASALIIFTVLGIEALLGVDLARHAEARALLFLPAISCVLLLVEITTAHHAYVLAAFVYRVLLPIVLVLLLCGWAHISWPVTAPQAATCYGVAWVLTLVVIHGVARRSMSTQVWATPARYQPVKWVSGSLPFMVQSLLMTLLVQAGVIVLELVRPRDPEVAIYGAVAQTGAAIVLVATSTNRFFLPQLSVLIERGDVAEMRRKQWSRLLVMGALCGTFLLICLLFGRSILGWYGEAFRTGYAALCVLAAAGSLSTLLALAPYYLQFVGRHRLVLSLTGCAALVNIGLCFALAPRHGALGAAVAYATSLTGMYMGCFVSARWDMRRRWPSQKAGQVRLSDSSAKKESNELRSEPAIREANLSRFPGVPLSR